MRKVALWLGTLALCGWLFHRCAWPPLRVSPETTVITSPLLPNGRPDYVTYLNQKFSEGVTPENNAAVILSRLAGGSAFPEDIREEFFRKLAVPVPGDERIFTAWGEFAAERGLDFPLSVHVIPQLNLMQIPEAALQELLKNSTPVQHHLTDWVNANQKTLELIRAASQKDRFYWPLVQPTQASLSEVLDHELRSQCLNPWKALLLYSAMSRLQQNDIPGAIDDALTLLRLGRLLGNSPSYSGFTQAASFEFHGMTACLHVLLNQQLQPEHVQRLRDGIAALPPPVSAKHLLREGERFRRLEEIISLRKNSQPAPLLGRLGQRVKLELGVSVNDMLARCQADFDSHCQLTEIPDLKDRWFAVAGFENDPRRRILPADFQRWDWLLSRWYSLIGAQRSDVIGLDDVPAYFRVPLDLLHLEIRMELRRQLLDAGLRAAAYRDHHGEPPLTLEQLSAWDGGPVPVDFFTGNPLVYQAVGRDFLIYSCGPNGEDDGGRERDELGIDDLRFGSVPELPQSGQRFFSENRYGLFPEKH